MPVFTLKNYLSALFLTTSFGSFAQSGVIKGIVKTSDGAVAPYVHIVLKELSKGTISDEQGNYVLKNVKAGNYTLIASFVGLQTQTLNVSVTAGQVTQQDVSLTENSVQLSEVVVTEKRSMNEKPLDVGKAGIKPMDLPQSVISISKDVIDQQQVLRLSDVLKNVSGLYVMGTTGGTQEELAGRGFAYNSSNTFKNGARFNNGVMPEMSALERVEIMKGSNAILFGNVAAGGVINLVTRKPKFENGGEISMRVGSYGFYKPSLDLYGTVDGSKNFAYRINTTYENAKSFRDQVSSERSYFNPSFLIKAGNKTEILVEGDYLKDNRTNDYGLAAVNYQIVNLPRNLFLGASWSYFKATQKSATITVTHRLNNKWKLKMMTACQGYAMDLFGTTRPNANSQFVKADGTWIRGVQRTQIDEDYQVAQTDLVGHLQTGKIEHTILVGADIDSYRTNTLAFNTILKYDSINVFDMDKYKQRSDIPELAPRTLTKNPTTRTGVYLQDLVSFTSQLKLLAGIRYSYMDRRSDVYTYATDSYAPSFYSNGAFSPRLGLVYQPLKPVSLFASYANSFTLNSGIDVNSKPLPPSIIDQYEAGIKNEFFNGLLSANVTAYKIVNSNFAQAVIVPLGNPANIPQGAQELAGEVTSRGIEVDIMSKAYKGFSVISGYSFNETKYTKSNIYVEGSLLRYNPRHTSNLSIHYTFNPSSRLKHFNVGWTASYVGTRMAGRSTRLTVTNDAFQLIPLSGYVQYDAYVGYSYNKISVKVKGSNLFNALSYNAHDDNSINPIAPRIVSATFSLKL